MLVIRNIQRWDGTLIDHEVPSQEERIIDARGLTLLPGLIDPHVHFRTPGLEHKEDWESGAQAAIAGGITTVFDMPNTLPPTITKKRLKEKKALIDKQLQEIPLRYHLYLGADKAHFKEIKACKDAIIGIKVFMGSSTGDLVMDDEKSLHTLFQKAAKYDLLVAVHAEDEQLIHLRKKQFSSLSPKVHSFIRSREVAIKATQKAIELSRKYGTRLYLLHISTKEEIALIKRAKEEGLQVFAETTPDHLFFTEDAYDLLGTKIQINPPVRTEEDCEALWLAIQEGIIDTIGSDHAPHTLEEKNQPYGMAPSGTPGVETTLPLLLSHGLSVKKIISLMKERIEEIFYLTPNEDCVLVDLNLTKTLSDHELKTKCGWSPFSGRTLKGWPVMTILNEKVYDLRHPAVLGN